MIERGCEFIEARDDVSMDWNQVVYRNVQNVRSLMQAVLRNAWFHLSGDSMPSGQSLQESERSLWE